MRGRPPHQRELLRICGLAAIRALFERDAGRVERLLFEPRLEPDILPFCRSLAQRHKPFRRLMAAELTRVAGTPLHGGIVAIARPQPIADLDPAAAADWARDGRLLVILDGVGNPHNLGAIARSAAFFGVPRLILSDRPDQALPSDAAYRVAEGGLDHLGLYRAPLPAALALLRRAYRLVGTAPDDGAVPPGRRDARPPALLLGNEGTGLAADVLAECDEVLCIPGSGQVQSLNVAAAAAILIYALTRP